MSELQNFLRNGGVAGVNQIGRQAEAAGSLFTDATWDQVGTNKELTDFLHQSLDPAGGKYGGDSAAMKQDILNTITANGSSALASLVNWGGSIGEHAQKKRFENLIGRLYESAPNRLTSGNLNDTYQAVKSGLLGGVIYDAPLLLATGGLSAAAGLGAKGLGLAGAKIAGREAANLAAGAITREGAEAAAGQVIKDVGREGMIRGAIREGGENALFGVVGDAAQQGAAINRENQDEFSGAQLAMNAVGGGVLGGALGALGGRSEGRLLGKELATGVVPDAVKLQAEKAAADVVAAPEVLPGDEPGFVSLADAHLHAKSNLADAADALDQFRNGVAAGGKSRYTPEQIDAIYDSLVNARGSSELSEALKAQANALRATGTPEAITKALELEQRATSYESLIKHIDTLDLENPNSILRGGDINPELVAGLSGYDYNLASALGKKAEPPAAPKAAGKPAKAATGSSGEPPPAAATTPAKAAEAAPGTPEGAEAELKAAPASEPTPENPTASDIKGMADNAFTDEEKAAYAAIDADLQKANIDLQTALDNMAQDGIGETAAKIATASGADRGVVQENLGKVAAASQREHAKVKEAAAQTNKAAPATETVAPEAAATADDARVEELTKQANDLAAEQQAAAEQIADMQAAEQALKDSATKHQELTKTMRGETDKASSLIDQAFADIKDLAGVDAKETASFKLDKAKARLESLKADYPDLLPLLEDIKPQSLTTERGVNGVKAKLKSRAEDAVSWTYTNAIMSVLPEPLNALHFDTVLRALMRKVPNGDAEATRIMAFYKEKLYQALSKRADEIGIKELQKDPVLGKAFNALADSDGRFKPMAGRSGVEVDVGQIVADQFTPIVSRLAKQDQVFADEFAKAHSIVGAAVREQFRMLKESGIKMDSQFAEEALRIRANEAIDDVFNKTFEKQNAGDYEKLAKMRELREQDKMGVGQSYKLSASQGSLVENPVYVRLTGDKHGRSFDILSGRTLTREGGFGATKSTGRPQSMLSDGISDYIGTLWAHPRRAYSAAVNARNQIWQAAVDNASNAAATMTIFGRKFSGTAQQLKGLYKEQMNARLEQSRFDLILDTLSKQRSGELGYDAAKAKLDSIGSRTRAVSDSEVAIAKLYLDSQERIAANTMQTRARMTEILADAEGMSPKAADQIAAILGKLDLITRDEASVFSAAAKKGELDPKSLRKGKAGENANKGKAETTKTWERDAKDAAVSKQLEVAFFPGNNGKVAGFKPAYRDSSATILSINGVKYEFVPSKHIEMSLDGKVKLFGKEIGTWAAEDGGRSVKVTVKGIEAPESIKDLTSISRKALVKGNADLFKANESKLVKAATQDLPEGANIDKSLSKTEEVQQAVKEVMEPAAAKPSDANKTISSFDVPTDRALAFKRKSGSQAGRVEKVGQSQQDMTVSEFMNLFKPPLKIDEVEIGTVLKAKMKRDGTSAFSTSQEYIASTYVPFGRDTGTVNQEIVKAAAAKDNGIAPILVSAKSRPITLKEAGKIKISHPRLGETTLDVLVDEFDKRLSGLQMSQIGTVEAYDKLMAAVRLDANIIESLAPKGVKRPNASRRTSFSYIQTHMAKFSEAERNAVMDVLRRLDADRGELPYFEAGEGDGFSTRAAFDQKNTGATAISIGAGESNGGGTSKFTAMVHEIGHWAFVNMLSPSERIQFVSSLGKYFDADGKLSMKLLQDGPLGQVSKVEKAIKQTFKGVTTDTNEMFAWQFSNHVFNVMAGAKPSDADKTMWGKLISKVKAVVAHFLGQKVDPELVPLFEKIMPSSVSEKKFVYDYLVDVNTGEKLSPSQVSKTAGRSDAVRHMEVMEKIDTLRGRLAQHMFTPGGIIDSGFAADLEAATKHMFGLLKGHKDEMGRSKGKGKAAYAVERLREKLETNRKGGKAAAAPGSIDLDGLFNVNDTGKLMQAIRDVVPDAEIADNVAFQAAVGTEGFVAHIADVSPSNSGEMRVFYMQEMQAAFKRIVGEEMKDIPIEQAAKYSDALTRAEMEAMESAAKYAKEEYNVDIMKGLMDDSGSRAKLGDEVQSRALNELSRKLYDLMSDAMDHLESKVNNAKLVLERSERASLQVEKTAEDAAMDAAIKSKAKKPRKTTPKQKATTEATSKAAAKEESLRVDGNDEGIPAATPSLIRALLERMPHRDKKQNDIIGAAAERTFRTLFGQDIEVLSNEQVSLMTGIKLEKGVDPVAPASSNTAAFDELRKGFRLLSENLTNKDKTPMDAFDFLADMVARVRKDEFNGKFVSVDVSINGLAPKTSDLNIAAAIKKIARGIHPDGVAVREGAEWLLEAADEINAIVGGLYGNRKAKAAVGEKVVSGKATTYPRMADGSMHPALAEAEIASRLANLPKNVADALVKMNEGAENLVDIVGFVQGDSKRIFATVAEMRAAAKSTDDKVIQALDDEIAKAAFAGDDEVINALLAKRDGALEVLGLNGDGVRVVTFPVSKVYDPMGMSDTVRQSVQERLADLMSAGKSENQALKEMGYLGKRTKDTIDMFAVKHVKDFDAQVRKAAREAVIEGGEDLPMVGEVFLNMAVAPSAKIDPLGMEQRALQAGAPGPVARVMSRMFKKNRHENGLTEAEAADVKSFVGVQLSSNSDRIRSMGGKWLADHINPLEGTGFNERLMTKMSTSLVPVIQEIDDLTGVNHWYQKVGREVYRNLGSLRSQMPQSVTEQNIAMAMRTGDISKLSMEERKVAGKLKAHFKELLHMQKDAGIDVADVTDLTNEFYLPQRFNLEWISANRDEAVGMLAKWFEKDRGAGASKELALRDAKRVINEAINKEELKGIIDGSSNSYVQAFGDKLHKRKLHIVGKDWDNMHKMFDNNIRSLLTSYSEAAHKRVQWSKTFGVRGHAAETYIEIASTGYKAALEALMSGANGLKTVVSDADGMVEGVSKLFNPTTKSDLEASKMVYEIVTTLKQDDDPSVRSKLVDALVQRHVDNGGDGEVHFRKHAESIVNGLGDFGDEGRGVAEHEMEFMRKMVGVLAGRPAYTVNANQGLRNAAGMVKTFNSVSLLSGAVLASFGDTTLSLLRSGSVKDWMKGTTSAVRMAMSDSITAQAMARVGVGMEAILNENVLHVNGGMSSKISNAFFQANMLTPWTNAMRQTAALVGFESIKSNQLTAQAERFAGRTDSWKYRKSMRYLRQLGLGSLVDEPKLVDFSSAVEKDAVAEAVHKFVNESVFQPNRNDMPLWTQDPITSIFWQFKAYPTMMGRLVKKNFKDAVAMEDGKYAGDPMGLMYLMTIGAAAGAGVTYAKDVVYGKNQEAGDGNWRSGRSYTLSKIVQDFGFKDFDLGSEGADAVLGTYAQGLLSLGALGFLGDLLFQSAKSVDNGSYGRERIMSQLAGPTLGLFSDTIQVVSGGQNLLIEGTDEDGYGSAEARTAVRKIAKRVPIIGGQDPWVEAFVNDTAGEAKPR
jgi:FtsZ-binding cell division protein ZapB